MRKGFVDFLAGGSAGAFVELAMEGGVELEKVEALHILTYGL